MSDASTDAVEAFIQGPLKEAVLSEGMPTTPEDTQDVYAAVSLLRALAAERDALRAALEQIAPYPGFGGSVARAALNAKTPPG